MAQLAIVLLALFGQMERTYTMERAAHARAVATAKGRRIGRPILVDAAKLDYAAHLRDNGDTIAEIVAKTGIARSSLYRNLPPRPAPPATAQDVAVLTDPGAAQCATEADPKAIGSQPYRAAGASYPSSGPSRHAHPIANVAARR